MGAIPSLTSLAREENQMFRQRWEARVAETGQVVSAPYYAAAPAYKVAQTYADQNGVKVNVERDGSVYRSFEPTERQS